MRTLPVFAALSFLAAGTALATPYTITAQLVGDIRADNPDNLFVDVTITGDTTSNQATWVIDINSPLHPDIKLDEFYFNMAGDASAYSFSGFDPVGWTITAPATEVGAGGVSFMFESSDPAGAPNALDVTNTQNLTFTMTYSLGNLTADMFTTAPTALSNDAGSGQLGAHLQSLSLAGCTGCSDSGFAFGNYVSGGGGNVPEPMSLALLGIGALAMARVRRR
ncbi:MAG: PEP-CTERM sorting domain-containing protein [Pseudomonadota bacterium]